jgi:hypothetical protein
VTLLPPRPSQTKFHLRSQNKAWKNYEFRDEKHLDITKINKVGQQFRIIHNEKLCDFYRSPSIIKRIKSMLQWTGHILKMADTVML